MNDALEKKGFSERVDHRSNAEQGLDALPTIHEGAAVRAMEKRGIRTEKGEWNRYIKSINQTMKKLLLHIAGIRDAIKELKKEETKTKAEKKAVDEILRMSQQYKETLLVYKEWYANSNPKKKADMCI